MIDTEVVIVGSGFSGLGAAVALQKAGIDDFIILEREDEFGGTWTHNDYPGLEVDMPFFIYSFPFEMKSDWSHVYPTGAEVRAYTHHVADRYRLKERMRCGAAVKEASFDFADQVWRITLESGSTIVSRFLVNATGLLVKPKMPDIEGIDAYEGKLIHSANWDRSVELSGKRVAVIGTGATSIQLIPAIADEVAQLDVYQRTAIWLLPKPNPPLSPGMKTALRRAPVLQILLRWLTNLIVEISMGLGMIRYTRFPWIFDWIEKKAVDFIRQEIDDEALADKLIPAYSFFCKRPSFSNTLYSTYNRSHVDLVTEPIQR